jgi:zinc protease
MRHCVALALGLALGFGLAFAAPVVAQSRIAVPHETFQLDNGLTVILHRDATTPTIATNLWYWVGSSHEEPGRSGFAHLFEHLLFEGSANVPEGKIDEWFEEVGGSPNGSTTRDRTDYMQTFSSNALDLALFIESDRMGHLLPAMHRDIVDNQRDVVKNERRQSYDNRPYGLASQILTEAIYPPSHPYSWPVIGYMDHLGAATYEDVVHFFETYYVPNNASLAIVGDIDLAEARRLAEMWFGDVPRGAPVPALEVTPPTIPETRRLMLEDRVQLPRLYMTWVSPGAFQEGDAALTALGRLLAGGRNSRLYQRLVYEMQIADDVSARQGGSRLGGEFQITATARRGVTLAELEAVILEELARVVHEAPGERELERIVNQNEVAFLERLELVSAKADLLNTYLFFTGTPDGFNEDLDRFRRLVPEDLSEAARQYLDPNNRVVLSIVPQGATELAIPGSEPVANANLENSPGARGLVADGTPAGAGAGGAGEGIARAAAAPAQAAAHAHDHGDAHTDAHAHAHAHAGPDRSTRPAVGEAPDVTLPAPRTFSLENGLRVVMLEKRDLPLVQVNLILDAGTVRDPRGQDGLASLTAALLNEGAAGMSSLEIADAFEFLGARFGIGTGAHSATMTLRASSQQLPEALELASKVLLQPEFPAHELDRLRAERLTGLIRQHDDPGAISSALLRETLFGAAHPYGRSGFGTEASLRAVSVGDLRDFYARHYRPQAATAILVGDLDEARARELLASAFGDWQPGTPEPISVPTAAQVSGRTIDLVDRPGSAQSLVTLARIGAPRATDDYYAREVMNVILGGSFTSRLNQNLREDKGYAYGASSSFAALPAAGPWTASSAVQTHSTGPALREFMNELDGMLAPIPEDEVARARNFLAMRYPAGFQSVAGIAGRLAEMVQFDLPADYFNRYVDNILAITAADVERAAQVYLDPAHLAIFVVGDRAAIEQQIRDEGLGPIRILGVEDVLGPLPVPED